MMRWLHLVIVAVFALRVSLLAQTTIQGPTVIQSGQQGPPGVAGPAGPTGPPGGSLSYPGCTSDGNGGFGCTGAMTSSTPTWSSTNNTVATKGLFASMYAGAWQSGATYMQGQMVSTSAGTYICTCAYNTNQPPNAYPGCWAQISAVMPYLNGTVPFTNLALTGSSFNIIDQFGSQYFKTAQTGAAHNVPSIYTGASIEWDAQYSYPGGHPTATQTFTSAGGNEPTVQTLRYWNGTQECYDNYTEIWNANTGATTPPTALGHTFQITSSCTALPESLNFSYPSGSSVTIPTGVTLYTPTPATTDNSTKAATTAYVQSAITAAQAGTVVALCRTGAPLSNTGSVTANIVWSCTLPVGSMGVLASMEFSALFYGPSTNTGTCSATFEWTGYTTEQPGARIAPFVPAAAGQMISETGFIQNLNSQISQGGTLVMQIGSGVTVPAAPPFTAAIHTNSAQIYLNVAMQNSVAADTCWLERALVKQQN